MSRTPEQLAREVGYSPSGTCASSSARAATASDGTLIRALREVYWMLREGEPDNALHALDAFLLRQGINPEDYAGPNALAAKRPVVCRGCNGTGSQQVSA